MGVEPSPPTGSYVNEGPEWWDPTTLRQLLGHMAWLRHAFEPKAHGSHLVEYDLDQHDIIPARAAGYMVVVGELKNNRRVWQFELTPWFAR